MTLEEKAEFKQIGHDVAELNRAIIGTDREAFTDGLIFRLRRQEEEMRLVREQSKTIKNMVKGIGVGILLAALCFGYLTLKDVIGVLK